MQFVLKFIYLIFQSPFFLCLFIEENLAILQSIDFLLENFVFCLQLTDLGQECLVLTFKLGFYGIQFSKMKVVCVRPGMVTHLIHIQVLGTMGEFVCIPHRTAGSCP